MSRCESKLNAALATDAQLSASVDVLRVELNASQAAVETFRTALDRAVEALEAVRHANHQRGHAICDEVLPGLRAALGPFYATGPIRCAECGGTDGEPRGLCSGVLHPAKPDAEGER